MLNLAMSHFAETGSDFLKGSRGRDSVWGTRHLHRTASSDLPHARSAVVRDQSLERNRAPQWKNGEGVEERVEADE